MNVRALAMTLGALVFAGAAAFLAYDWLDSQKVAQPQSPELTAERVLVAREAIPVGSFLDASHVRWQPWPADGLAPEYLVEGASETGQVIGAVARTPIAPGEPITTGKVVKPGGRGFLAAVLRPGMRAVTVPIDAASGIAGFVFPGDEVDLILTHLVEAEDNSGTEMRVHNASETIITGVRVLAVDQRTTMENGEAVVAKTATLEVTPKEAEAITLMREVGVLNLSLRSLAEPATDDSDGTRNVAVPNDRFARRSHTWDSDISAVIPRARRYEPAPAPTPVVAPEPVVAEPVLPPPPPDPRVTVIRGTTREEIVFRGPPS